MENELRERLSPQQRSALEEFHHGHISAGELQRRVAGAGGSGPQPAAAAGDGSDPQPTQAMPVPASKDPVAGAHGVKSTGVRHKLFLLALAILLGVAGAAVAAGGVAGGSYRGSTQRSESAHRHRRAGLRKHVASRAVHHTTSSGGTLPVRHAHKAAKISHQRVRTRPHGKDKAPAARPTHRAPSKQTPPSSSTSTPSTPTTSSTPTTPSTPTSTGTNTSTSSATGTSTASATTVPS